MKQRWAMFTMGAWLAGNVMVAVVATENFYTVDRLLAGSTNRVFASQVGRVGQTETRDLLRYLSSELNRRIVWLTPEIISVGRSLDFVPRNPPPPALRRFWILHGVYTFLEGCKLVVGAKLSVDIATSPTRMCVSGRGSALTEASDRM